MQRKTLHFALDFFLVGAAVPLLLLGLWRLFFGHVGSIAVQDRFLYLAFILWPTGIQILVVPHGEGSFGHALAIGIMVVQNAILYSIVALAVHWVVVRLRHLRVVQTH